MCASIALYPDSEMPQGTFRVMPYSICRSTAALQLSSRRVFSYVGITRRGMRYSNIEPSHERRVGPDGELVSWRPRENQFSCGTSPCAIATKLANLASDASRS